MPAELRLPPVVQLRREPRTPERRLIVAAEAEVARTLAAIESDRTRYLASLRRRVGPDAEDVYQQSLLRAIEHVRAHREPERPSAWFWSVLRNAVADHHAARHARDARHAALLGAEDALTHETAPPCACAMGLLSKLPEAYGEMLRRVDVCDERVVDVARELGISADNANVRLHRARKAMRERLQGCCKVGSMRACFACDCHDESHGEHPAMG